MKTFFNLYQTTYPGVDVGPGVGVGVTTGAPIIDSFLVC